MVLTRLPDESGALVSIGTDELGRLHKALLPRLELLFGAETLSVELSSPGIDRHLKEGAEFALFAGRRAACYLPEKSDWVNGVILGAGENAVSLENEEGTMEIDYQNIAKAKLI